MISPEVSGPQEHGRAQIFSQALYKYGVGLVIIIVFFVGVGVGKQNDSKVIADVHSGAVTDKNVVPDFLSKDVSFKLFWDAWATLRSSYVDQPINESQMLYGAIAGMTASLGDPHTAFFDPKATELFNNELDGSFEGIGAEIAIKKEQLVIVAPLEGSPAQKSGLKAGDKVVAIDGEDTFGMTLEYAVSKIRGPKGTTVKLLISRNGTSTKPQEFEITRQSIQVQSVSWKMIGDVAYIKISTFHDDTKKLLDKAITQIIKKDIAGIVLDLRGDPGGYLDTAIEVGSAWIKDGVIVYEKLGDGTLQEHRATGAAPLAGFKTIVLINQGSASASEIVAGALKDMEKATIVGEKSFGKGSVQQLFPFAEGSSMKVTIAKWLTPNKNTIDKVGITPDIEVKLTDDDFNNDKDPQLDKALELLGKK